MFGIGMPEMLMILAIALIVIGPKKLPDLAKSLGRAFGEFKRATNDLKESLQAETGLDDVRSSFKTVDQEIKNAVDSAAKTPAAPPAAPEQTPEAPDPLASVKKAFEGLNRTAAEDAAQEAPAQEAPAQEAPAEEDAAPSEQPSKPQETPPE